MFVYIVQYSFEYVYVCICGVKPALCLQPGGHEETNSSANTHLDDGVSLSGLGVWKVLGAVVWRQRASLDEDRNRQSCHGAQCGGADSEPERGARRDRHCALRGKKTLQQI